MDNFLRLLARDLKNAVNKRMFFLLAFMVLFQIWFIIGSGSVSKVMEQSRIDYMAIVLSFNTFGSLTALALTFDSISRERKNKVMDILLTSGINKRTIITSKITVNLAVSLIFSVMYVALIALVYLFMYGNVNVILMCMQYIPGLTAFIFIYSMLGLMLSIFFRSSMASFIVSMIIGFLLMPRLLITFIQGISNSLGLGQGFIDLASMSSPALIMNALGGCDNIQTILEGIGFLTFYIAVMAFLSIKVFLKQDELNYDE